MPIEGCISLNRARAKAKENSVIIGSINQANSTIKPVEVATNTKVQVATNNETNNKLFVKQELQNTSSAVAIAFPHENYIQQGLQIIKDNHDIGKTVADTREYIDEDEQISKITIFNHGLKIFFPSDVHMAAVASYYKNKYGVNIHIVCESSAKKTYDLMQQLNDGEQLGIIARPAKFMKHVTPLIISKQNEDIFIIVLDSVDKNPAFIYGIERVFKEKLTNSDDKKNYHLMLVDAKRQADLISCRNDALIILKDALRKPNVVSYFEPSSEKVTTCEYQTSANSSVVLARYQAKLPAFLFKTVQINSTINNFTDEDKSTVLKISAKGYTKTLKTHLDKYNRAVMVTKVTKFIYQGATTSVAEHEWLVNEYLLIKGFLMLAKAFPELDDGTGKIDASKQELLLSKYFYADS